MTSERWKQVENLYHAALELPPGQRSAYLDEACASDDELRREVVSLLASHEQAHRFIEAPPDDVVAGMIAEERANSMLGRTFGHYRIISLLGAGGMGEVYRARDTRLDRDVAVKILPEQLALDAEALRRFEREAKAVATLSHPNILSIFDFGAEQSLNYAVMERLEGETLRSRLAHSPLGWRESAEVCAAIAEGLAAAHAKGIIHRDLKPENIFLTTDGQVKILDFGIARVKHAVTADSKTLNTAGTTRPGTIIGTLGYMSPEQVKGTRAEAPSDIFSLGCVLYEMVSGQRPFAGATGAEVIAAILKEDPPQLSETAKGVQAELERIIGHCLEKRPEQRFQSASDLAFDLRAMQRGGAITASARARRRVSAAFWLGAAVVITLLVIGAWLLWRSGREQVIDSLAILPLVNASGDTNLEYLSDGITESLINNLSQLPQLRVMARGTVFSYKDRKDIDPHKVGQELQVRAVFTGRMAQRGDTLNIQADLVNAADGSQLWGERYAGKLSDLLATQEEIARRISEGLRLKLSGREQQRLAKRQTTNIEAHQLYLKGRYYFGKGDEAGLRKALEEFKQAIDLDPNYALAYAGMADVYYFLADDFLPSKEAMPRARAAALKSKELDETLAEAHVALAGVKANYDWEWAEAERAFKRALELNPGYAPAYNQYGIFLITMERFAEAQVKMDRARELDPLSPFIHVGAVWPVYFARQYDQAVEQLRRVVALNPDFPNAYLNLGWAYAQKGMYEEAITALRKAKSLDDRWLMSAPLGYTYAKAGHWEEAQKILAELQERARREQGSEFGLAMVYSGLGEKDQAFAALERAYQMRNAYLPYLKFDPFFDSLRSDPRFTDLLRRMNLAP